MPVRVQIAGVSTLEEALALERLGADALGFTVRLPSGVHDGLTEAKARGIIAALPPFVTCVAITYIDNARDAADLCRALGVAAIQLHGECPPREIELLRAAAPHLKIIRAVHVTGAEAVATARALERRVDAIILDTYDPATGRGGATGKTHDWEISRRIVESVRVPIILAGGLTPGQRRRGDSRRPPWAVDVHTGVEDADGTRNLAKMRAFIERAKHRERVRAAVRSAGCPKGLKMSDAPVAITNTSTSTISATPSVYTQTLSALVCGGT